MNKVGSRRQQTSTVAAVTSGGYGYDAFGNLISSTFTGIPPGGTSAAPTANEFLFGGEQYDADLHLYYNRARYLNTSTGRFWTMGTFEGDLQEPISLHAYVYTAGEPVNSVDPTGNGGADDVIATMSFTINIGAIPFVAPEMHRRPPSSWRLSAFGALFMATFEGYSEIPYNDEDSRCTYGYGHVIDFGVCTTEEMKLRISMPAALALFNEDVMDKTNIATVVNVPVTQYEFDALTSFAFNAGIGALKKTTVELNRGEYGFWPHNIQKYVYAHPAVKQPDGTFKRGPAVFLPGLQKRRGTEALMYLLGMYPM